MRLFRGSQYITYSRAVSSKMTRFTCLQKRDISNTETVISSALTACFDPKIARNFGLGTWTSCTPLAWGLACNLQLGLILAADLPPPVTGPEAELGVGRLDFTFVPKHVQCQVKTDIDLRLRGKGHDSTDQKRAIVRFPPELARQKFQSCPLRGKRAPGGQEMSRGRMRPRARPHAL